MTRHFVHSLAPHIPSIRHDLRALVNVANNRNHHRKIFQTFVDLSFVWLLLLATTGKINNMDLNVFRRWEWGLGGGGGYIPVWMAFRGLLIEQEHAVELFRP